MNDNVDIMNIVMEYDSCSNCKCVYNLILEQSLVSPNFFYINFSFEKYDVHKKCEKK